MQTARAIRDKQTDLRELVRKDREGYTRGEQVRAARRILADDPGALAVLEGLLEEARGREMVEG